MRTTCCAKYPYFGPTFPCDDCPAEIDPEFKPIAAPPHELDPEPYDLHMEQEERRMEDEQTATERGWL